MALTYYTNGSSALDALVNLFVLGDGTSTTITIDMKKPPLNFKFGTHLPVDVVNASVSGAGGGSVALNTDHTKFDLTLGAAPAAGQSIAVSFELVYGA